MEGVERVVKAFTSHFKLYEHSPEVWLVDLVSDWTDDEVINMIRALPPTPAAPHA